MTIDFLKDNQNAIFMYNQGSMYRSYNNLDTMCDKLCSLALTLTLQ